MSKEDILTQLEKDYSALRKSLKIKSSLDDLDQVIFIRDMVFMALIGMIILALQ